MGVYGGMRVRIACGVVALVGLVGVAVVRAVPAGADDVPAVSLGGPEYVWQAAVPSTAVAAHLDAAAVIWGGCGLFDKNTKVIRAFTRVKASVGGGYIPGGTSNLACGSEAWGYRHIVKNHLDQWEADAALDGGNWRDLADLAMSAALGDPDTIAYRSSNDTFCYSHLIYLVDKRSGKVAATRKPITIVARVSKNIITSYPSNSGC